MAGWVKEIFRTAIIRYFELISFSKGKDFLFRFGNKHSLFSKPFRFRFKGIKIFLDPKDFIQNNIFFFKVYEKLETDIWNKFCSSANMIFDVGANIGYYSLLSAKNSRAKIYAFEPVTDTYTRLKRNIELNGFSAITPVKCIISDTTGIETIYLPDSDNTGMATLINTGTLSGSEKVEKILLDDFVDQNNIKKLDLVKIDVEGNEMHVIRGMNKILDEMRPALFVEVLEETLARFGISVIDVYAFLEGKRYRAYEICGDNQIKRINKPKEKMGLILFLPENYTIPHGIKLIE